MKISKIVLTGGPCAGKTTIFNEIEKHFEKLGYYVITVPETATELIKGKLLPKSGYEHTLMFQDMVFQQQYIKEYNAEEYAKKVVQNQDVIILYDRAIIDNRAYLDSQKDFDYILHNRGFDEFSILNKYDLVIDLVSTATNKKDSYKTDEIRSESLEEAAKLDNKTSNAWVHHYNFEMIQPTKEIADKTNVVIDIINNYLAGFKYHNKEVIKLDSNNDLSFYNVDNSKTIEKSSLYLKNNIALVIRTYQGSTSFSMYRGNCFDQRVITQEEFINYIYNNKIYFSERVKEILFVENGKPYKLTIDDNDNIYLEKEKNSLIPNNLLRDNNYEFCKTKKYDTIY